MSCCEVKKPDTKVNKDYVSAIKKYVQEVVIESKEDYQHVTLRDKINKSNYDYAVWLDFKIKHANKIGYSNKSSEEMLNDALKEIADWIELLVKPRVLNAPTSLFDDGTELLTLPESPGPEGNWNKYSRETERVNKENLKRQHSFFELCKLHNRWFSYSNIDWTPHLPSNDELIQMIKDGIAFAENKGGGRFENIWWDNSHNYIPRGGELSDRELKERIRHMLRVFLLPYKKYAYNSYDMSYQSHVIDEAMHYRYYYDSDKINIASWENEEDFPKYNIYTEDFLLWIRKFYNVKKVEIISDENILKKNMVSLFSRLDYDFESELKKIKSVKEFKAHVKANTNYKDGCSGSGISQDGFNAWFDLDNPKNTIVIKQSVKERLELGRSIENLKFTDETKEKVYVWHLSFDQFLEKAFDIYKVSHEQLSLFDFIAA